MKKILTVFLALITVATVSLTACDTKGSNNNDDDNDDWDNDFYNTSNSGSNTSDTDDDSGNNGNGSGNGTTNGGSTNGGSSTSSRNWTELTTPETVYALQALELRSSPSENDRSGVKLTMNTSLTRTAISTDSTKQWAKVTYNNNTYYVYNAFVSKNKVTFTDVNNIATFIVNSNPANSKNESTAYLRTTPCLASANTYNHLLDNVYASLTKSETEGKLVITGYDEANQCARVKYYPNGMEQAAYEKDLYILATLLDYYKTSSGTTGGDHYA